ncbi:MAG: hypothetical protein QGH93_01670 [Gammaproteobacteria bacterium]|jgi:DMSO/TMAO reductase YedYZ heme-binding membrane subunit|nr:hypothetical protein [Gammaproteobacteria bacterium]
MFAALIILIMGTVWAIGEPTAALDRLSLVSAYLFLMLISYVLLIGPLQTMRTGRVAINHILRRDVAIWGGIVGLVHLVAGSAESMTPVYLDVFINHASNPPSFKIRESLFFWSAIIGFIIGPLLIILLALSNNWSLALMGQKWWKRLHRISYLIFVLTVLHGFGFQVLESRGWAGYGLLGSMAIIVCTTQVFGFRVIVGRPER